MDLYIQFYDNLTEKSIIVREILEYVMQVLENIYNLTIEYIVEKDPASDEPYMIVNDLEPVYFDKIPDIEMLIKILLIASDSKWINDGNSSLGLEVDSIFP